MTCVSEGVIINAASPAASASPGTTEARGAAHLINRRHGRRHDLAASISSPAEAPPSLHEALVAIRRALDEKRSVIYASSDRPHGAGPDLEESRKNHAHHAKLHCVAARGGGRAVPREKSAKNQASAIKLSMTDILLESPQSYALEPIILLNAAQRRSTPNLHRGEAREQPNRPPTKAARHIGGGASYSSILPLYRRLAGIASGCRQRQSTPKPKSIPAPRRG